MLTLYRTEDCPGCRGMQSTIEAMVLAHKVVIVKKRCKNTGAARRHKTACACG